MMKNGNFFNKSMETASRKDIFEMQSARLKAVVKHVYESNATYRQLFDEANVKPEDIRTADDVAKLPMTNKDILRDNYPLGLSCVPRLDIAEMHMSSGSTGTPVVMETTSAMSCAVT